MDGAISDVVSFGEFLGYYCIDSSIAGSLGVIIAITIYAVNEGIKTANAVNAALPEIQDFLSAPVTYAKNAYDALSSEDKAYIAGQITEKNCCCNRSFESNRRSW